MNAEDSRIERQWKAPRGLFDLAASAAGHARDGGGFPVINLTPHEIKLVDLGEHDLTPGGVLTIPASGYVARLSEIDTPLTAPLPFGGLPVVDRRFEAVAVSGPDGQGEFPCVFDRGRLGWIVSLPVAQALAGRLDVVAPDTGRESVIRGPGGQVEAVRRFVRIAQTCPSCAQVQAPDESWCEACGEPLRNGSDREVPPLVTEVAKRLWAAIGMVEAAPAPGHDRPATFFKDVVHQFGKALVLLLLVAMTTACAPRVGPHDPQARRYSEAPGPATVLEVYVTGYGNLTRQRMLIADASGKRSFLEGDASFAFCARGDVARIRAIGESQAGTPFFAARCVASD